jgi:hypothetical protein
MDRDGQCAKSAIEVGTGKTDQRRVDLDDPIVGNRRDARPA